MHRLLVVAQLIFVILVSSTILAQTQVLYQGMVTGTVVDDAGQPVENPVVCFTVRKGDQPVSKGCTPAGFHGEFKMPVPLEAERVYAEKPDAGYLDDSDLRKVGMAVHLTEAQPTTRLTLKIGPKPARLTFQVTDKDSGKPVEKFRLSWMVFNEEPPGVRYTYSTARKEVFVPSNREVMVFVQAHGYRRWFYLDAVKSGQPTLLLQPGEQRTISAALESWTPQN